MCGRQRKPKRSTYPAANTLLPFLLFCLPHSISPHPPNSLCSVYETACYWLLRPEKKKMRLTLNPHWRLRPLRSFLGFMDLKTGAQSLSSLLLPAYEVHTIYPCVRRCNYSIVVRGKCAHKGGGGRLDRCPPPLPPPPPPVLPHWLSPCSLSLFDKKSS